MTGWDLPRELEVNGVPHPINADFRDVLDIVSHLSADTVGIYVALALFYDDFDAIPEGNYMDAINVMFWFINGGEEEKNTRPHPKMIDWEQDRAMIVADINKVAGCEVRALPFCHWWTFLAWFNGIGDGQLSTVVSIREKLRRGKKLTEWEREFYRKNRDVVDFKTKYTEAEKAALAAWGV